LFECFFYVVQSCGLSVLCEDIECLLTNFFWKQLVFEDLHTGTEILNYQSFLTFLNLDLVSLVLGVRIQNYFFVDFKVLGPGVVDRSRAISLQLYPTIGQFWPNAGELVVWTPLWGTPFVEEVCAILMPALFEANTHGSLMLGLFVQTKGRVSQTYMIVNVDTPRCPKRLELGSLKLFKEECPKRKCKGEEGSILTQWL